MRVGKRRRRERDKGMGGRREKDKKSGRRKKKRMITMSVKKYNRIIGKMYRIIDKYMKGFFAVCKHKRVSSRRRSYQSHLIDTSRLSRPLVLGS